MTITYTPQYRLANLGSFTSVPSTTLTTATFGSLSAGTSYDFRVIADNGIGQSTSVPFTQITTSVSESAQNASITQSNYTTSFIYDANLVQWSLQTPNNFSIYSSPPPYTSIAPVLTTGSVTLLLYWNHTVYQQNSTGNWWSWNGSAWATTSDPRPTIVSVNLSNSSFPQGASAGTVVGNVTVTENTGNTFSGTFSVTGTDRANFTINSSNQLVTVGSVPAGGPWSINIVATSNQLAVQNSPFTQAESITETSAESIEGTVVNTIGPIMYASPNYGHPSTGTLNQFELQTSTSSGTEIFVNQGSGFVYSTGTANVQQLVYHNNTVFHQNTAGGWWYWNTSIAFPPNNPWTSFSVGSVALNATTYPSGASAGSQVGAITINETGDTFGGTFGGTLALSGTNASSFAFSGNNLVVAPGVTLSTNTATNYSFTITATVASGGSTPTTIGTQNSGTITLTNSAATATLIQIPVGIHTGAGLGGNNTPYSSGLVHYNAFNGTGTGGLGLTAQGRHTTVLATCLGGGTTEYGGASPDGWTNYTDAGRWVSLGFPTDGTVSPMIHWAFSDSSTNKNFTLYSNAQIRTNTSYPGSSGQTIEHWIRATLSQWTAKLPNIRTYYIRPMWEWNIGGPGANYDVGSAANMPNFVEAFRGFANVCHDWGNSQNPRIAVKLLWSASVYSQITSQSYGLPVIQQFPAPDSNARPASDGVTQRYIDVMGPDFYWYSGADVRVGFDGLPTNGTFSRTTNQIWTMNALVDLALFYNIPIAISETGFINGYTTMYQNFFPNIVVPWINTLNVSTYRSVGGLAGPMRWEFMCWFDLTLGNAYCFSNPSGGDLNMVGQAFGSLSPTTFGSCAKALTVP